MDSRLRGNDTHQEAVVNGTNKFFAFILNKNKNALITITSFLLSSVC
jgi:hypothetical protein